MPLLLQGAREYHRFSTLTTVTTLTHRNRHSSVRFPKMETMLAHWIRKQRLKGNPVRSRHVLALAAKWAEEEREESNKQRRMEAKETGNEPKLLPIFRGGSEWQRSFRRRQRLSLRRPTNTKPQSTTARIPRLRRFHRSLRRFRAATLNNNAIDAGVDPAFGDFPPERTFNTDQSPVSEVDDSVYCM